MAPALRGGAAVVPAGRTHDQVDAISLVGQLLDQMTPGSAPKVSKPERRDGYERLFARPNAVGSWRTA